MDKRFIQTLIAIALIVTTTGFASPANKVTSDANRIGDQAVLAALWQQSAEAQAIYYQTFNLARWRLDEILRTYNVNKLPAIVVAIDNTLLDNGPLITKQILGKTPLEKELTRWYQSDQAKPLPGALKFLNYVNAHNVNIFYVTDRPLSEKEATLQTLKKHGFPQVKESHLFFKTKEESKESRRQTISVSYEIIMLIGDRLSDLASGFDNASLQIRAQEVNKMQHNFGKDLFLLPNPLYGDWEAALYNYQSNLTNKAKLDKRLTALK